MKTLSNDLAAALDAVQQQTQQTIFLLLSECCKSPEFSLNKALLQQVSEIKTRFSDDFSQACEAVTSAKSKVVRTGVIGEVQKQIQALALVDREELAFKLKVDEFIDKAEKQGGIQLALLVLRFEAVLARDVDEDELPFAAENLITIFKDSVQAIELDREEKTAFFSRLCHLIHSNYARILSDANNLLIDNGILNDLNESDGQARLVKRKKRLKAVKKRKSLMSSMQKDVKMDEKGDPIPPDMDELLSTLDIPQKTQVHQLQDNVMGDDASTSMLLSFFDELTLSSSASEQLDYQYTRSDLSLAQQLQHDTRLGQHHLSKSDANSISMMSMLYEDIFSNQYIAEPIKALLEDLQGPLLKNAILDKNFFADAGNPAQTLLDLIAEQGASWAPDTNPEKDFFYKKMSGIVKQVNSGFDGTYAVFEDAVIDFREFQRTHEERTGRIEARIVTAEKAKARFDRAHKVAKMHIDETFSGFELTPKLNAFISDQWQQVLFYIHNKYDNADSSEWRKAQVTERLLLRNFEGDEKSDQKKALLALQQMMLDTGFHSVDIKTELRKIFGDVKALPKKHSQHNNQQPKSSDQGKVLREHVDSDHASDTVAIQSTADSNQDSSSSENLSDNALTLEKAETENDSSAELTALSEKQMEQLQAQLSVGSWLISSADETEQKIKVAAYIKHTDTFILVHRNGTKYANYDSLQMYQGIRQGELSLLESAMMFDRALESVITTIRAV